MPTLRPDSDRYPDEVRGRHDSRMLSTPLDATPDRLAAARALLTARTVRDRAQRLLELARTDALADWILDERALPAVADTVAAVVRDRYPRLDVPPYSCWRRFTFDGRDLWAERAASMTWADAPSRARAEFDLAVVAVLLDVAVDPHWRYRDAATGIDASGADALALATLRLFEAGGFSGRADEPLRVDAASLIALTGERLARGLGVSPESPLPALEAVVPLLQRLGHLLVAEPTWFDGGRPGGLFDTFAESARERWLPAAEILRALLLALGELEGGRARLAGVPLGDCWVHAALDTNADRFSGFVPLHASSQRLAYSLIEPLQRSGVAVTDVEALTGIADQCNGELFIDGGVLRPRARDALTTVHEASHPLVVGWRSLTVALLDELAPLVRARLDVTRARFPLACLLEGGTAEAGRRMAAARRPAGAPLLTVVGGRATAAAGR